MWQACQGSRTPGSRTSRSDVCTRCVFLGWLMDSSSPWLAASHEHAISCLQAHASLQETHRQPAAHIATCSSTSHPRPHLPPHVGAVSCSSGSSTHHNMHSVHAPPSAPPPALTCRPMWVASRAAAAAPAPCSRAGRSLHAQRSRLRASGWTPWPDSPGSCCRQMHMRCCPWACCPPASGRRRQDYTSMHSRVSSDC